MLARASILLLIVGASWNPMSDIQNEQKRETSALGIGDLHARRITPPLPKDLDPRPQSSEPETGEETSGQAPG